jgi:hypothetical protein
MNCYFDMQKEHTEEADHVAYARYVDAVRNGRHRVGHRDGDDILWSYVRGRRCELAFFLWLGGRRAQ